MANTFTATSKMTINAPIEKVWQAFTDPAMVKQWLFGTDMEVSAWEAGGQIRYRGEWQGKTYEDKGEILEIIPQKKLVSTYWSSMSGTVEAPENYQKVTYELSPNGDQTDVTITQEGSKTEDAAKHSEGNWNKTLASMKQLLEK